MSDLVITGGIVVDGTGDPQRLADIAVSNGIITEVAEPGSLAGSLTETIDATGLLVTPGFVDIHTHFDGQVTWDPLLTPTCWHGVTSVVMGNCGVGFAPVSPDRRDWLIGLMEGVEDIPGAALSEGIRWEWETFSEYLDAVDRAPKMLDVAAQIPHGAVRAYVMGERGARNEPATSEDIAAMAAIVRDAIAAGALGFSTSRTIAHMAIDGEPVPGTFAAEDELFGLGNALKDAGGGVFELAPAGALGEDLAAPEREMDWMRRLAAICGRPVSFALTQNDHDSESWRRMLDLCAEAASKGSNVRPQVAGRPVTLLLGLKTFHPFAYCPSWGPVGILPLDERVARMADPEIRRRLLAEASNPDPTMRQFFDPDKSFPLGDPPDYEPHPSTSIAQIAQRAGADVWSVFYDALMADNGHAFVMRPLLNYTDGNLDAVREMLMHPTTVWGLGDGGAHCGTTCDASTPTYMLTHWARDREAGIPLETVIKKMTSQTAGLFGLGDRGVLAPGMRADINLIDHAGLTLHAPVMVHDLPGDARRFIQRSTGYVATILAGQVTLRNGEETGARPGALVRGAR
ncbi:N-acyl-D-aspartate/D-glutamate deacylase [Actinobacteria bacterium IMCC26256]|nr:N-acyl-D-aspartate/D-glutamate deacylase [Actinobacteria bacterium IMCC26256]